MPSPSITSPLTEKDQERIRRVTESFSAAWHDTGAAEMAHYLLEPGDPLRVVALHALVRLDMETRWRRDHPVELETYLHRFPELGTADTVPVDLIYEEYRIRHQCGDKPRLDLYQTRFPRQFEDLTSKVREQAVDAWATVAPTSPTETIPPPQESAQVQALPLGMNRYKLIKRLASGSFAEVFLAEAPGGVRVAVKRLLQPMEQEEAQRELKSLELTKQLRHAYLIQYHAYWREDDRLCVAMELADGTLRDRFKQCKKETDRGIPLMELLGYFREAAEAIDFMHEQKFIHRDIKPENIMLLQGHAKVADFGLARLVQSQRMGATAAAGTPRYMAPEVWDSRISKVGREADQYSLAVTYAELRRGQPPFPQNDMMSLMLAHQKEPPDLSGLPEPEAQVLLRAMAKKPADRFRSNREFMQALYKAVLPDLHRTNPELFPLSPSAETLVEGGITAAERAAYPPTVVIEHRRRRVPVWLAGALGLLLLAVLAWKLFSPAAQMVASGMPTRWDVEAGRVFENRVHVEHGGTTGKPEVQITDTPVGVRMQVSSSQDNPDDLIITATVLPDAAPGDYHLAIALQVGAELRESDLLLSIGPRKYYLPPHEQKDAMEDFEIEDGRVYYKRLLVLKPPLSTPVPFLFVHADPGHQVAAFYIMESKVSTEQYAKFFKTNKDQLLNKKWSAALGQEKLPVTCVPVEDAHKFAVWLVGEGHGFLPREKQWDEAAGRWRKESRQGPFRGTWLELPTGSQPDIAVARGSKGPMDCNEAKDDVSWIGAHDMAGNGMEWTRTVLHPDAFQSLEVPVAEKDHPTECTVIIRGRSFLDARPLFFEALDSRHKDYVGAADYRLDLPENTSKETSFRVVLEM